MIVLLAILSAPILPPAPCPITIRIGEFSAVDDRNTTGLNEGCARRHGGDSNWCAAKVTKKGEGNYHVICRDRTGKGDLP